MSIQFNWIFFILIVKTIFFGYNDIRVIICIVQKEKLKKVQSLQLF